MRLLNDRLLSFLGPLNVFFFVLLLLLLSFSIPRYIRFSKEPGNLNDVSIFKKFSPIVALLGGKFPCDVEVNSRVTGREL